MLRSFNLTIDAEVAEVKISEKMLNSLKAQSLNAAPESINNTELEQSTERDSVDDEPVSSTPKSQT